jgi:hypothetical protein
MAGRVTIHFGMLMSEPIRIPVGPNRPSWLLHALAAQATRWLNNGGHQRNRPALARGVSERSDDAGELRDDLQEPLRPRPGVRDL